MEEKRREEWMAILRQSRLCRNLEEKELLNLMEQEGTVRTYSRGERIFQETDRPDSVYMLLNGSVIIAKETFSGKGSFWRSWKIQGLCSGRFMPLWRKLPMICMWKR